MAYLKADTDSVVYLIRTQLDNNLKPKVACLKPKGACLKAKVAIGGPVENHQCDGNWTVWRFNGSCCKVSFIGIYLQVCMHVYNF